VGVINKMRYEIMVQSMTLRELKQLREKVNRQITWLTTNEQTYTPLDAIAEVIGIVGKARRRRWRKKPISAEP
jgi:hypothetical protein